MTYIVVEMHVGCMFARGRRAEESVTDFREGCREGDARGWLSLAKGGGLKTRSRRGPWVRIPALAYRIERM